MPSGLAGVVARVGASFLLGSGGGSEHKGARGGVEAQRGRCGRVWQEFWWARVGCACGVCVWGVSVLGRGWLLIDIRTF